MPSGPWSDAPTDAAIVPIRSTKLQEIAAFLIAGVSPRLRFDQLYRSFLELLATQIYTAIANARAYEEERRRAEALAEIDRAKTAFFSNVSHEFRTPLTLMLGPAGGRYWPTDATACRRTSATLEVAHRNALRLLRLVNTLLDFSRIEAGRVQASYEPDRPGRADRRTRRELPLRLRAGRPDAGGDCSAPWTAGLCRSRDVGEDRPQPRLQRFQVHV